MYWLYKFGDYEIPGHGASDSLGTAEAIQSFTDIANGRYDYFGSDNAPLKPGNLSRDTVVDSVSTYTYLRSLVGKRDKLYRIRDDAQVEWAYARLIKADSTRKQGEDKWKVGVSLEFALLHATWYAESATTVTTLPSSSTQTITVTNSGNVDIANPVIGLTLPTGFSEPVTSFTVRVGQSGVYNHEIKYTGDLNAGDVLVFDCGAKSITVNGVDAYAGFSYTSTHKANEWLKLKPGDNSLRFVLDGITIAGFGTSRYWIGVRTVPTYYGSSDAYRAIVSIVYYNGWR